MYLNHFSMIHFCLSNCIFPTTSSPNPCHTTWSSKHKFSTVDRHQGLQRQIMLKQFASLKNCRCTWQLIWQIYVYEADTIEINRNINMVLRFWKYTDMIWYALQWWTMFLWRLAVSPKICWSAWICMKTNELSNDPVPWQIEKNSELVAKQDGRWWSTNLKMSTHSPESLPLHLCALCLLTDAKAPLSLRGVSSILQVCPAPRAKCKIF